MDLSFLFPAYLWRQDLLSCHCCKSIVRRISKKCILCDLVDPSSPGAGGNVCRIRVRNSRQYLPVNHEKRSCLTRCYGYYIRCQCCCCFYNDGAGLERIQCFRRRDARRYCHRFCHLFFSQKNGFSVNRMILTGIGIQAMLQAVINFIILKTSDYNIADALRWLSGSLNGSRMSDLGIFGIIVIACTSLIITREDDLLVLGLGEELPVTLGLNTVLSRRLLIYGAVALCAGTTAVTGPLCSVAFMSGHIAAKVLKTGGAGTIHSGMVGAILVLFSEAVGQFAFATRYPAGVITGIFGAPYLIYLLTRLNQKNG